MPYVLNAYRTENNWTRDGTLKTDGAVALRIMVEWSPVYIQTAPEFDTRGESWEQAVLFNRGYHTFQRAVSRVRVRSALIHIPALVTIEAVKAYE